MADFPVGLDFAWLACDVVGHVAVFTNAGAGPVPTAVLAERPSVNRVESMVRDLPCVGGHTMHVLFPRPDDYIRWAERGLFAYDWRDSGRYEIIATPEHPVTVGQLPAEIARLARLAVLSGLRFIDSLTVYESELGECER
jgi:hypothetical protein